MSLDIGRRSAFEIFAVKRNIVSEISQNLLNHFFAESDESSRIKNITTDKLNLGKLQVDDTYIRYGRKYKEIYINQVNQVLSRCFFSVFGKNWG